MKATLLLSVVGRVILNAPSWLVACFGASGITRPTPYSFVSSAR
jgi:hypothetical protein